MYIIFEGPVGSGKTTQSKKLTDYFTNIYPKKQVVWTREPGGSEIANIIRKVVQGTQFEEHMEPYCEAYLFAASRAQTLRTIVKPVIKNKGIVIQDNSFVTGLANQGFARGLGVKTFFEINKVALAKILPDIVIFLNIPPKKSTARTFDKDGDKFEALGLAYAAKVYAGYKKIAKMPMFKGKWINIDAQGSIDEVFDRILKKLIAQKLI